MSNLLFTIEENTDGQLMLAVSESFIEKYRWRPGDVVSWSVDSEGTVILVNQKKSSETQTGDNLE